MDFSVVTSSLTLIILPDCKKVHSEVWMEQKTCSKRDKRHCPLLGSQLYKDIQSQLYTDCQFNTTYYRFCFETKLFRYLTQLAKMVALLQQLLFGAFYPLLLVALAFFSHWRAKQAGEPR